MIIKDKVVCVSNIPYIEELTIGAIYEVVSSGYILDHLNIINDRGYIGHYETRRFVPLDQMRLDKLNKLGIC